LGTPQVQGFLRMNDDGSVVPAGTGTIVSNFESRPSLAVQADNKVLILANSSANGKALIRVLVNDTVDADFHALDVYGQSSSTILYADDGRMLLTNATVSRDGKIAMGLVMMKPEALPSATPVIVTEPADLTVALGSSAHLGVNATGIAALAYQWYEGTSGDTSHPISGAIVPNFDTPALSASLQLWVRVSCASSFVDSRTVTVAVDSAQTFAQWIAMSGAPVGQRGALDTPAGDGVSNLIKFALGVSPLDGAGASAPTPELYTVTGQSVSLALIFARNPHARDVGLALEVSNDLVGWTEVESAADLLSANSGGSEIVRLREVSPPTAMRRFARLKVELITP
jgi:hypothetical protein